MNSTTSVKRTIFIRVFVFIPALLIPLVTFADAPVKGTLSPTGELERLRLRAAHGDYWGRDSGFERRWFVFASLDNAYPGLEREELIQKYFNPAMRLLAPGFEDVYTITDLRDDHLIWPPHVGFGRTMSKRWTIVFQAGYTAGKVRSKATDPSILLLPLHTDFEIRRGAFFWGFGVDYHPFGAVELRAYDGIWERLAAARPSLGTRLTWTRASFKAKIKVGFVPIGNIIRLKFEDAWSIPSVNLNVGFDVPIDENNALHFNGGYNIFADQRGDFEGTAFTISWKHYLK